MAATTTETAAAVVPSPEPEVSSEEAHAQALRVFTPGHDYSDIGDNPITVAEYFKSKRDEEKRYLGDLGEFEDPERAAFRLEEKLDILAEEERGHRVNPGSGGPGAALDAAVEAGD